VRGEPAGVPGARLGRALRGAHLHVRVHPPHREELAYIVHDCGARVFICSDRTAEAAAAIVADTPHVEARFIVGGRLDGHRSYEEAVAEQSTEPLVDP